MTERFEMIGHHCACQRQRQLDNLIHAHDDFTASVKSGPSRRNQGNLRLMVGQKFTNSGRKNRIAGQVQAWLSRHFDEVADTVLHQ